VSRSTEWLTKWIYILAAILYFVAVCLRTILFFQDEPTLGIALALLLLWALVILSEPLISRLLRQYFPIYLLIQTSLVFLLMALPGNPDFMGALLGVLSMQVMLRLPTRVGFAWIGTCAVIMMLLLAKNYGYEAIALSLVYTAGTVFLGSFTRTIRQTLMTRQHNQSLAEDLEIANRKLVEYSAQLEDLSAARERNRLARELHDSVTQTVFSMSLTSQSAALLLKRDPSRVGEQLERLYDLARNALAEMQMLIVELKPTPTDQVGLGVAVRQLLADNRYRESLTVAVESQGNQPLSPTEQQSLYRIIQEALNNIVKHAHTDQARIQLHLVQPIWIEIEDHGTGFDVEKVERYGRLGLASMEERAVEIGWELYIFSSPGTGTRIRIEKPHREEGKYEDT
jgi:signal transduction histidine kinase